MKNMKNMRLAVICAVIAAAGLFYVVGVATNLFASPAFSSFWWLSKTDAYSTLFFVPSVIGPALIIGEYFWFNRKESNKT